MGELHMNGSASNDIALESLREQLGTTLSETRFDLEYTKVTGSGDQSAMSKRGLAASELAEVCQTRGHGIIRKRAYIRAPEAIMLKLVEELRVVMAPFIDPDTGRLGHAFPIDRFDGGHLLHRNRSDGLSDFEFESAVADFANCLVQMAAIVGVDRVIQLLVDWKHGEPVRFWTSTFVNGFTLNAQISPRQDIKITPLPLTTTELPRLPRYDQLSGKDYLGLTVLSLAMSASPALFRPKAGKAKSIVRSRTEKNIDLNVVCDALSLQANCYVSQNFLWTEYEEAAPFSLSDWQAWKLGTNSFERARCKSIEIDSNTGAVTLERHDDVSIVSLDEGEVVHTIEALQGADGKLRIAVDRWKKSKRPSAQLEDRYIDLRSALETLYLKDFANENSGEMRFRLSLFGAWYLGSTVDERRDIRKTLRDAYDTASGAVHSGEVPGNSEACLGEAQELCRQGILKLLREGTPKDWGDLILGASPSEC